MATIDCTLDSFMIPGVASYSNEFGTKKETNEGLSTAECIDVTAMPFTRQRPFTVTETSSTTEVQANSVFKVTASGVTLTIADAAFDGAQAIVINASSGSITVKGGASGLNGSTTGVSLASKAVLSLIYCSGWYTVTATGSGGSQKAYSSLETGGAATVNGNLSATGTLTASGAATLKSAASVAGELSVTGASTLTGDVTAKGALSVAGDGTITGDLLYAGGQMKTIKSVTCPSTTYAFTYFAFPLGKIPEPTSTGTYEVSGAWDVRGSLTMTRQYGGHSAGSFDFCAGHYYSHSWKTYYSLTQRVATGCRCAVRAFQWEGSWWLGLYIYIGNENTNYKRLCFVDFAFNLSSDALQLIPVYGRTSAEYSAGTANHVINEEIYDSLTEPPSSWSAGPYIALPLNAPSSPRNEGTIWLTT